MKPTTIEMTKKSECMFNLRGWSCGNAVIVAPNAARRKAAGDAGQPEGVG
jgi:hypothetical protein